MPSTNMMPAVMPSTRGETNIWSIDLAAQVLVLAHARDHHGGRHRDQQAGDLRHQRVTDGQQDVAVGGLAGATGRAAACRWRSRR